MGPKPTLGLKILASLRNEGPNRKGCKIRCLQMPLFWFISFVNGIKRIREKKFCFDVRLRPNPRTRHTSRIHGAGCNSEELCGIRMSEFLPLLLRKQATIGSLSQNLFCQLQAKGEWLTILESLKKKNKQGQLSHLRLLPKTSLDGTCLLSPSLLVLVRFLPQGDLSFYLCLYLFLYAFIFNS